MKKLYQKNELTFALVWIAIYCILESLAYPLSERIGIEGSAAAILNVPLTVFLFGWVRRNGLGRQFGLHGDFLPAKRFLWYIPLMVIASRNLWNGVAMNRPALDTLCYVASMFCVGFLEELLIRGFLFRALVKDGVKSAIIITSVSFGLAHVLNMVNGRGMGLVENLHQMVYAVAIGFLFAVLLTRGGSLWPCIAAHAGIDVASAFVNEVGRVAQRDMLLDIVELSIIVLYTIYLARTMPVRQVWLEG